MFCIKCNKNFIFILTFFFLNLIPFSFAFSGSGSGTSGDPYIITTPLELNEIRDDLTAYYELGNDINVSHDLLSGEDWYNSTNGWEKIGDDGSNAFEGTFDGKGYSIYDYYMYRTEDTYIGLFGGTTVGGVIKNLNFINANVTGENQQCTLVGENYGHILNCNVTGSVTSTQSSAFSSASTGGLVVYNRGNITNSYFLGDIFGRRFTGGITSYNLGGIINNSYFIGFVEGTGEVGGIVGSGSSDSIIDNCYFIGNISASDESSGGILGISSGSSILNSYSSGNISGEAKTGGLAGYMYGVSLLSNSYSDARVSAIGAYSGGLVGESRSVIKECNFSGSVSSTRTYLGGITGHCFSSDCIIQESFSTGNISNSYTSYSYVGGVAGTLRDGTINNSYSTGNATSPGHRVGGLVGYNYGGKILHSYSTGIPTGGSYIGGLTGYHIGTYEVNASYWNNETSGITTSADGEQLSDSEMKTQESFVGWDFTNVWSIDENINDGYPHLLAFISQETPDTCSCPGLDTNWEIDMSDSCNIETNCNLGLGNITFTGTGTTIFNANINCSNLKYPITDQILNIGASALIYVG